MNNPFGLPDELFGAILASAITEGMNTAGSRSMKKSRTRQHLNRMYRRKMVQLLQRKSMIPM